MTTVKPLPRAEDHRTLSRSKWDGIENAFYEIDYVHWNDPAQQVVGWFRMILFAGRSRPPELTVVGALIDGVDPGRNRLVRQSFPIDQVVRVDESTGLEVGSNGQRRGRWWGEVTEGGTSLRWDFQAEPGEVAMLHLPSSLYRGAFPPTKIHAPYFRARYSGEVVVDGRTIAFRSVLGNSSHYWGREVIQDRTWISCQIFREDPEFGFEGVSGRARLGPWLMPRVTYLSFLWDGVLHNLNGMSRSFLNTGRHHLTGWEFAGRSGRFRFLGRAVGRPERMVAHRLESPDGRSGRDQSIHTDFTSDLTIRVEQRRRSGWTLIKTMTADRTAAFETSQHDHDPRVRWAVS